MRRPLRSNPSGNPEPGYRNQPKPELKIMGRSRTVNRTRLQMRYVAGGRRQQPGRWPLDRPRSGVHVLVSKGGNAQ